VPRFVFKNRTFVPKQQVQPFLILSGAYQYSNYVLSSRFGNKRDDYALYQCFLQFKYRYIVSFQRNSSRIPQMHRHGCIYNRRSAYLSGFCSGKGRGQQDAEHVMPYSL